MRANSKARAAADCTPTIMNTTSPRVASCELRVASDGSRLARSPLATRHSPLATRRPRRAISLLEVLIAMFVMLFGLMGVAAIMPVGNHYAARSDQYDRGAALAGSAFAELKSRGLLQPGQWFYANQNPDNNKPADQPLINSANGQFWIPMPTVASPGSGPGPGHAFFLDPIGGGANTSSSPQDGAFFPFSAASLTNPWVGTTPPLPGTAWPIRRVTFAGPNSVMKSQVAESIFRLRDDLSGELPDQGDQPGIQRWETDNNGTPDYPADDTLLARAYAGSYSWLATVLPVNAEALLGLAPGNPRHGSFLYEVSVAVFRKREDEPSAASERLLQAELGPGGDLVVYNANLDVVDEASLDIRAGNWIAIAGVHPTTGKFLLKWYRLLAYDDETDEHELYPGAPTRIGRRAMLEGPEWPPNTPTANPLYSTNLRAILLPNVIGVATQTVKLETN
jgi:hypothetical protein